MSAAPLKLSAWARRMFPKRRNFGAVIFNEEEVRHDDPRWQGQEEAGDYFEVISIFHSCVVRGVVGSRTPDDAPSGKERN